MKQGSQQFTFGLALILALAQSWNNQDLQEVWQAITVAHPGEPAQFAAPLQDMAKYAVFVGIVTFLAGLSKDAGKIMVVIMIILWLLFLMSHLTNPNLLKNASNLHQQAQA